MSDKAMREELMRLKEQVAELQSARTPASSPQEYEASDAAPGGPMKTNAEVSDPHSDSPESTEKQNVEKQIQDFVDALDQEIKSTNPMTALVVFSLGVLIGRLLPR